jgi:hypothetical protein
MNSANPARHHPGHPARHHPGHRRSSRRVAQHRCSTAVSHLTGNPEPAMVPPAGLAITADPGIARRRVSARNPENPAKIFSSFASKFLS